jgi:hypothetical protein
LLISIGRVGLPAPNNTQVEPTTAETSIIDESIHNTRPPPQSQLAIDNRAETERVRIQQVEQEKVNIARLTSEIEASVLRSAALQSSATTPTIPANTSPSLPSKKRVNNSSTPVELTPTGPPVKKVKPTPKTRQSARSKASQPTSTIPKVTAAMARQNTKAEKDALKARDLERLEKMAKVTGGRGKGGKGKEKALIEVESEGVIEDDSDSSDGSEP